MMKNYFHSCALIVLHSLPIRQNSSLDYDTVISLSATKVLGYSECTEYSHPWKAFVCSAVFWYTVPLIGWHTYSCTPPCNPLPCSEAYRAAQPTSRPVAQLHLLSRTPVYPAAGRHGISLNARGCILMHTSLWFYWLQSAYLHFISVFWGLNCQMYWTNEHSDFKIDIYTSLKRSQRDWGQMKTIFWAIVLNCSVLVYMLSCPLCAFIMHVLSYIWKSSSIFNILKRRTCV